ncbi:MAG: MFS transporter [Candidatus Njordarchaeota archaeon]
MEEDESQSIKLAKTAIIAFGLISLFGDIIYEGARSSIPTYLELLGASAVVVGFAIGLGEFVGYALRLVSGYVADTTKAYWALTIMGYGLIISIPLLALAFDWRIAVLLVIIERLAKAIRTPARDTLISVTTKGIGRGKAFGLHELFDQIGATVGPAMMAFVVYYYSMKNVSLLEQFRTAFLVLFIPYALLLVVLLSGYLKMRAPAARALDIARKTEIKEKLTGSFYLYSFAVMLNTAGLFHIALILYLASYIFENTLWLVPILYLLVQGIDAATAPLSGAAYDRYGRKTLMLPFVLSVAPTLFIAMMFVEIEFIVIAEPILLVIAVLFFGIILGMQESIYRAAVADMTGVKKRGTGYGIFNTAYGLGFLLSGVVLGYFLDMIRGGNAVFVIYAVLYSVLMQVFAVVLLALSIKKQ